MTSEDKGSTPGASFKHFYGMILRALPEARVDISDQLAEHWTSMDIASLRHQMAARPAPSGE